MVLESCFREEKDPWDFEGLAYPGGHIDDEDIEAVVEAIEWLDDKYNEIQKEYGRVTVLKEVSFSLSRIHPDLWGTSDIVMFTDCLGFLGVYDYKHGRGKTVPAEENLQLLYYGLGAINYLAYRHIPTLGWGRVFHKVELGIIQPRLKRKRGPEKVWRPKPNRLDHFSIELREAAKATEGSTEYSAGSHCFWCNAQPICPQIFNKRIETAKDDFKGV